MNKIITINPSAFKKIREIDERLVSYNVEMTEVTGGTFWREYTQGQIAGTEEFPPISDLSELQKLMQFYEPIDLTGERIRTLSKALGAAYVRVSGSWATGTYYDFDGHTGGVIPESFQAILTAKQWEGLLDFVKAIDAKLMISVANCNGVHNEDGSWNPKQARQLFEYSKNYGVPIDYAEFMNEPNTAQMGGAPDGYTEEAFGRDQDDFFKFIRENYPETMLVGPSACGDMMGINEGINPSKMSFFKTTDLLGHCKESADIFSYHYYNGISERGAVMGGHWDVKDALSEAYLDVAENTAVYYGKIRDEYCVGAPMWVTESGDAGCGGNTWASTFLDTFRTLNELGAFAKVTDGAIFHNTLASSDYGYLGHKTHLPRPNCWAVLLWSKLMGESVYESGEVRQEGTRFYVHSRKDGKAGYACMVLNLSETENVSIDLPVDADTYTLSSDALRSTKILLNETELKIEGEASIPSFTPVLKEAGNVEVAPKTITFFVIGEKFE